MFSARTVKCTCEFLLYKFLGLGTKQIVDGRAAWTLSLEQFIPAEGLWSGLPVKQDQLNGRMSDVCRKNSLALSHEQYIPPAVIMSLLMDYMNIDIAIA